MEREQVVYEVDGQIVADVRSADELAKVIELYPGWAVVEKVKLSEKSRGGIIMPNAETKDQQHLMLFRVATTGPAKVVDGKEVAMRAKAGRIVVLKPSVAQYLVNQRHQFGVVQDSDIIGNVNLQTLESVRAEDDTVEMKVEA